ncbi:MAG: phenylalanine--tRNA ligase subunit beta [Planctomycetales bacterium]|nr:phenylalanine--tRNA ligase subunit beta [Planctomycetales bacterium]
MLVCWDWLSQYVNLQVSPAELATRFAMSGLNHESTFEVGIDTVIDLEVTSNRGDCLGHIGVAREASVLLRGPLEIPNPQPATSKEDVNDLISVLNEFPESCTRYTARVIRGVKIGTSPAWLSRRLNAVGIASVNNVVDVTNYVMMECGQPLHAFDLRQIRGGKIIVRRAHLDERFEAIDHKTYALDSKMIVIADAERAVALGGVMGGAESEVAASTVDLLIEAALFEPLAIRRASRKLKLQSPSSFRFERRPDPGNLDWASRRCCELILQVAGGTLLSGVADTGPATLARETIGLRLSQVPRILGIEIEVEKIREILLALGCDIVAANEQQLEVRPPTWRGDLYREVDLIEEVARLHGYDQIPEDVPVPLTVAARRPKDIVLDRARHVLSACGIDEAMTPSVVSDTIEKCGSLWSDLPPLCTETPLLVGSRNLRRSILPSLLAARYANQAQSIRNAQLYEVANIYLPTGGVLPKEQATLAAVCGDLRLAKGIVEELLNQIVAKNVQVEWRMVEHDFFETGSGQSILLSGKILGWLGLVNRSIQDALSLDHSVAAIELNADLLVEHLEVVRRADKVSAFPAVCRDLNFIVDEELLWKDLSAACTLAGREHLTEVNYQETYRDIKRDGVGKKRVLLSLVFQSLIRTLTSEEVDQAVADIIEGCKSKFGATLLG